MQLRLGASRFVTALAFALGTAVAFSIVYFLVARAFGNGVMRGLAEKPRFSRGSQLIPPVIVSTTGSSEKWQNSPPRNCPTSATDADKD